MDTNDAQTVLAKLNEEKIQYKIEDNVIKVPEEKCGGVKDGDCPYPYKWH
jgi:flagellar biosynthesis/type III secretory pathway M-ring protein FliF/YscJ